jgi:hypothetical protein
MRQKCIQYTLVSKQCQTDKQQTTNSAMFNTLLSANNARQTTNNKQQTTKNKQTALCCNYAIMTRAANFAPCEQVLTAIMQIWLQIWLHWI